MIKKLAAGAALAATASGQDLGPGVGPWEFATPESQGLSSEELRAADAAIESAMGNRVCYVVAKNGKIVHERYMGSGTVEGIRSAWSVTKSMCASLFGIAEAQGWANTNDLVRERNAGTRLCNTEAQFRHVLTMTGTSPNIEAPRYSYDTLGTNCLDTLSDFISQNNPSGVGSGDWMERQYFSALGIEHSRWLPLAGDLLCGFSADTSCRDLARMGQLWANDGVWKDVNGDAQQLMARQYSIDGRTCGGNPAMGMGCNFGRDYGYTIPTSSNDPVDPTTGSFVGMNAQCVQFSPEHNAVIVSMGNGGGCGTSWTNSRSAIVSNDHPLFNATRHIPATSFKEQAAVAAQEETKLKRDIMELAPFMREHASHFNEADIAQFNEHLVRYGGEKIVSAEGH
jgi:CubicO group peptidase (beta-lactamase class C family)